NNPAVPSRPLDCFACARNDDSQSALITFLTSRPEFQTLEPGGDVEADLTLQAQRLQRDRVVGAADQPIAAATDANRCAALRAGIIAGEITRPEPVDRRVDGPGQRGFLGDAEIEPNLADGRDVAVLRKALHPQHATKIGDGADDKADAGAAAA